MNIQKALLGFGLLSMSIALFPSKTEKLLFKKPVRTLTIHASKKEPPRIAFEELNKMDRPQHDEWTDLKPSINLNQKIEDHFAGRTIQLLKSRKLVLAPLRISRQINLAQIESRTEDRSWTERLPKEQQRILAQAQARSEVLEQDWHMPSWRESLNQELEKIKAVGAVPESTSKVFVSATNEKGLTQTPDSVHVGGVEMNPNPAPVGGVLLRGRVQLEPGLGLGDGKIVVQYQNSRSPRSAPQSQGRINLAQGIGTRQPISNFEIQVPDQAGVVTASLYSGAGEKLGEGNMRVSSAGIDPLRTSEIVIHKVTEQIVAHHVDLDREIAGLGKSKDYGDRGIATQSYFASYDTQQKSDSSGRATMDHVTLNSWALVRSEAKNYSAALNLVPSGREEKIPLMKNSFREALVSLARDNQKFSAGPETGSIVWGRALFDGKVSAGVEVAVEFQEDAQVVYFNALMIPDPNLKATSENGYFAILQLPEGLHSVISRRGENYFAHSNIATEPETVTNTILEASSHIESSDLSVFDAFQGAPQAARIELQSLQEEIKVQGHTPVLLQNIHRLSYMTVIPEDPQFVRALYLYNDDQQSVSAALIREEWIQVLRRSHKIDDVPETGTIVGFVSEESYDVYLSHELNYPRQNVIYFDARGEIMPEATPGGGFVLFNVPAGTQSVVLVAKNSQMVSSQVLPMDPRSLAVLNF